MTYDNKLEPGLGDYSGTIKETTGGLEKPKKKRKRDFG